MSDGYKYTPKFGLDMRIRPPKEGEVQGKRPEDDVLSLKPGQIRCEWPECHRASTAKAPKSREMMNEYYNFCQAHAGEYNKNWNFFSGMSEGEAKQHREATITGGRPTWQFRASRVSREAANFATKGAKIGNGMYDPHSVFGAGASPDRNKSEPSQRQYGKIERQAFADLDLDVGATAEQIRVRYTEMLKRCHPDNNGGDRSAEDKLQRVIKAYKVLKKMSLA
ncbi:MULTISPECIES: J domain-containing protein [Asticcacaulis]|uniref:Molecular chaperone DnaJ n=1 Tax=Asticcacaulis endophyticus TaxID=1395890 RepID=A0A918UXX9_9CAUL|nr:MULTISPECIES: J domain-containing protein [Asticcacaulis]WKL57205.1 J domain-containing protein [Asticcacaulis sp. ZE23SCel15]GGZ44097.1 molecular chaperone DnaJ [Asticcacaulis endophyticus]